MLPNCLSQDVKELNLKHLFTLIVSSLPISSFSLSVMFENRTQHELNVGII